MTQVTANDYWIDVNALTITLNALDDTEYIQCTVSSGAKVMCYMKGITGLEYDSGHNYRRWTLNAYPTIFKDTTKKYVYIAIPRSESVSTTALVCFPSEKLDIYGMSHTNDGAEDDVTTQVGSVDYYYIYLDGIISESQTDEQREAGSTDHTKRNWESYIETGILATDEAYSVSESIWYSYSSVDDIVTFLKDITFKVGKKFINFFVQKLTFKNASNVEVGTLESVPAASSIKIEEEKDGDGNTLRNASATAAVSTAYLKAFYDKLDKEIFLRKYCDDTTEHSITVKGNLISTTQTKIEGNIDFCDASNPYEKGLSGGRITNKADAELKSLVLRESLTVPKITYNCEEWIGGNTWRSQGGGVIKAVSDITDTEGNTLHIALLDIKADEGGKIHADDKCQGIFHLTGTVSSSSATGQNETEDHDYHNGHFTFRGFKTIYFLINSVQSDDWLTANATTLQAVFGLTEEELNAYHGMNAFFAYSLRSEVDATWTDATHPQPQLNFAEYANNTEASRQQVSLITPEYDLGLTGMTGWTYGESNIVYICRKLDGFTINDSKGNAHVLTGYGIAFGKAYMWGNIQQFDRDKLLVSQQLYRKASDSETALTVSEIGQSTDTQATSEKPYLWGYWHYTYDDGSTSDSDVYLSGNWGEQGAAGKNAPRKMYIASFVNPTKPTDSEPAGWTSEPSVTPKVTDIVNDAEYPWSMDADNGNIYQATNTDDGSESELLIKINVLQQCVIPIDYEVLTEEDRDFGYVYVDDIEVIRASGTDAGSVEQALSVGEHTITLKYVKDSEGLGSDYFAVTVPVGDNYEITEILDNDGKFTSWSEPILYGNNGNDGKQGAAGEGINTVVEQYGVSTDASTKPTSWDTLANAQTLWNSTTKYLWNKETYIYTGKKLADSKAHIVAIYSEDGKGITAITNYYKASALSEGETKDNTEPTVWNTDPSLVPMSKDYPYLWNYEKIEYTTGDPTYTAPCIIGNYAIGDPGERGSSFRIEKWETITAKVTASTPYHLYAKEEMTTEVFIADIVIYNNVHYLCIKDYDVTTANKSKTPDTLTEYFKAFNEFSNIATGVLLAEEGIIDNLLLNNMKAYPKKSDGSWDNSNPTVEVVGNTGVLRAKNFVHGVYQAYPILSSGATTGQLDLETEGNYKGEDIILVLNNYTENWSPEEYVSWNMRLPVIYDASKNIDNRGKVLTITNCTGIRNESGTSEDIIITGRDETIASIRLNVVTDVAGTGTYVSYAETITLGKGKSIQLVAVDEGNSSYIWYVISVSDSHF